MKTGRWMMWGKDGDQVVDDVEKEGEWFMDVVGEVGDWVVCIVGEDEDCVFGVIWEDRNWGVYVVFKIEGSDTVCTVRRMNRPSGWFF